MTDLGTDGGNIKKNRFNCLLGIKLARNMVQSCVLMEMVMNHLRRGGADKYLARPNSRCHMTESFVTERGACSCAELQVFSCYKG